MSSPLSVGVRTACLAILLAATNLSAQCPSGSLPAEARATVSAAVGSEQRAYHAQRRRGVVRATNPAHDLVAVFNADGVRIDTGPHRVAFSLEAIGRGSALVPVIPATPEVCANRVDYRRGDLTEWWVNGPLGLQQGFTLAQPPAARNGAPLTLSLALRGGLRARVDENARGLTLVSSDQGAVLRYAGLIAYDASGKRLDAWMEVAGAGLTLRVDDTAARYPVVVDPYVESAKLTASDGAAGDTFGIAVAISGDTIVVGAHNADIGGNLYQGAAYVFEKPAAGWAGNMTQVAKLSESSGASGDRFGYVVAIDGDTIVVGAYGALRSRGLTYVFEKPTSGWTNMTETARLTASDGISLDLFGWSVAIDGDTIVSCALKADLGGVVGSAVGAAYLFEKPTSGWANATETAKLTGTLNWGAGFGESVAVSGDTVVVGSMFTRYKTQQEQGVGFVFVKPATGWTNTATYSEYLAASDGNQNDHLGSSIAMAGDTVVLGAMDADVSGNFQQGAAYMFEKPAGGWVATFNGTKEVAKFTPSDGAAFDRFGNSTAFDGETVVIGAFYADVSGNADQGAAYVFEKPAAGWASATETAKLTASDGGAGHYFGFVAAEGTTVVVGAFGAAIGGNSRQGAAYVYARLGQEVSSYPGTGCGLGTLTFAGFTSLGTQLSLGMSPCGPGATYAFLLGLPISPLGLSPTLACTSVSSCLLSVQPIVNVFGQSLVINFPNNPSLVGGAIAVQGTCLELSRGCLSISDMTIFTVSN